MEAVERKVYSATGQDGIIEYIFSKINFTNKVCVEFGAEFGTQCNTRYMKEKYDMKNIWLDGYHEDIHKNIYKEFITQENIVSIFQKYNVPMSFDILAVDIDGNDWYVLYQILLASYKPRVIICEYNAAHPPSEDKIILYEPMFIQNANEYFGASLLALQRLMNHFGYSLIATDSHGIDSFYVLDEYAHMFDNVNKTEILYHSPKYRYGDHNKPYGLAPDPQNRPYISSKEILEPK